MGCNPMTRRYLEPRGLDGRKSGMGSALRWGVRLRGTALVLGAASFACARGRVGLDPPDGRAWRARMPTPRCFAERTQSGASQM